MQSRVILGPGNYRLSKLCLVDYTWDMTSTQQARMNVTESNIKVPCTYRLHCLVHYNYSRGNFTMYDPLLNYTHDKCPCSFEHTNLLTKLRPHLAPLATYLL